MVLLLAVIVVEEAARFTSRVILDPRDHDHVHDRVARTLRRDPGDTREAA